MKRLLILTLLTLTTAALCSSSAPGQSITGTTTSSTTSTVTPTRDRTRPFKFTTSGSVSYPSAFCAPNTTGADCVPLQCPIGVVDVAYCTQPNRFQICNGQITITFRNDGDVRALRITLLKPDCTYRATTTIGRRGTLQVSVKYGGNVRLAPSQASTKTVRAG